MFHFKYDNFKDWICFKVYVNGNLNLFLQNSRKIYRPPKAVKPGDIEAVDDLDERKLIELREVGGLLTEI